MKRLALLGLILLYVTVVLSQSSFYYYKGSRVPLNENPLVRYVCLDKQLSDEDASIITRQLENLCWRVDVFDSTFKKYYINLSDLNDFLGVINQNSSNVILHTPNYAPVDTDSFYPVREVLVKSRSDITVEELMDLLNIPFERIIPDQYNPQCYSITLPSDDAIGVAATLYETGYFDYSEPNFVFSSSLWGYETNPMYYEQWAILNDSANINLLPAWNITTGDSNIKVAVLDIGVEQDHPDLQNNMSDGYDAVDDLYYSSSVSNGWNGSLYDAHGTNCTGVICAVNNNIGIIGVAHTSKASSIRVGYLRPVYVRNLRGIQPPHPHYHLYYLCMETSWIITGLRYACYSNMSDVLNCSFGVEPSDAIETALTEICLNGRNGKGCVVVAAAGNNKNGAGVDTLGCIARHRDVISVGSINPCGERVIYNVFCDETPIYSSCYGDSLDVMAPGIMIPTTTTGFSYLNYGGGTSLAAPHVAGVAALVLSVNPCLTREEVKYVIESTCTKTRQNYYTYSANPDHPHGTWNNEVGYGLVNAYAAVQLAQQLGGYTYMKTAVVSENDVWTDKIMIGDSIVVNPSATLTITDTVYMSSNARIIVYPGGKLIVNGGTLTSAPCSNRMWHGIEVLGDPDKQQLPQYQGKVELLNGAKIENALCGIYTGRHGDMSFSFTGGIINADSAIFLNNNRSVVINPYFFSVQPGQVVDYNATFIRCSFTVNNHNLFLSNNSVFSEHVKLWDVKGTTFTGCSFSDSSTNSSLYSRGIYTEDAGVKIGSYCRISYLQPDCQCPETNTRRSIFSGFNTALEISGTGTPYSVTVSRANFSNNVTGVRINGNQFVSVTQCGFDLQNNPVPNTPNCGLVLNTNSGYKVEQNTFERATYPATGMMDNCTGLTAVNSGSTVNCIYRNNFFNLTKGIVASGINSDLQIACDSFCNNKFDIHIPAGGTVASQQGSQAKGADNRFNGTQISSIYNESGHNLLYYYSVGNFHTPIFPVNVSPNSNASVCDCAATICNLGGGGIVPPIPSGVFLSGINTYTSTLAATADAEGMENGDGAGAETQNLESLQQALSKTYYDAVRAIMSDSLLNLNALEQWHTAAQPIADPYSLTETRFCEGYSETFTAAADDAELSNYAEFHTLKLALRNQYDNQDNPDNTNSSNLPNSPTNYSPTINWYALTPAQIAQLQVIAERNTGRASVMAKGVLCFFFGICYEDEVDVTDETNPSAETRTKRTANDMTDDAALTVYPNPTDDLLYIELSGAGIATVALYDLQGRLVETLRATSLQSGTVSLNVKSVPAGVYVLRVTDANGKEYRQKIVKR